MKEIITGNGPLEEGPYEFTVIGVPEKHMLPNNGFKRIWNLGYIGKNGETTKKFHLFGNQYNSIVLAIGGKKVGNDVEWDDEQVEGRTFSCTLKVTKSKDGKFDNYYFENCQPIVPF